MFNGLISDVIGGVARHLSTGLGGYLLAHGLITSQDAQSLIGSVCFLAGLAWSVWQKYQAQEAKPVQNVQAISK